jgi:hypothetical protein
MVDNPTKIYNDYVRANLPNSMSYDTGTDRYDINSHSFFKFKNSNWYFNYISKYGYSALTAYAVNGLEPALVFDFKGNYFRKSATDSTFGASITHAASTNATMVDSDGLLKWRPHNLLSNSSVLGYSKIGTATSTSTVVSPSGLQDAVLVQPTVASGITWVYDLTVYNTGVVTTISTFAKASGKSFVTMSNSNGNVRYASFNLTTGAVGTVASGYTANIEDFGNGWYRCSVTTPTGFNDRAVYAVSDTDGGIAASANGNDGILLWGAQLNRSDLGGMVNNPDRGDSYVPTTTSAVYLSRRGHHVYNGSAWVNEGILHESQARTNLLTYSNDFANAAWSKTRMTANANQTTGPDGTVSATEIGITGTATTSYAINSTASTTGTLSYFAKQNTEQFFVIVRGTYSNGDWAIFDLSDGTVSKSPTRSGSSAHMFPMGNGWYRCVLQSALASTVNAFSISGSGTDNTTATSGTVYLWGAQLESGSTPSSYIPTTSATVTRAADTLTVPAANLPYDNTNMSIQIDGKITYADSGSTNTALPWRWRLNNSNIIYNRLSTSGSRTGQPQFLQGSTSSGTDSVVGGNNVYSPNTNVPFNLAGRYGSTFINGAHEGTLLTVNTTPTGLPALSSTNLELGQLFMGTIGQFRMWSDDLGDVGITEAST